MRKVIELYKYFSDKRYSTIAGTLVYFLLMSIAPFTMWLSIVCGNINVENLLSHDLFVGISPFLRQLKASAESATDGAGIIFLITTLYSSTNFFYHLRRSGEIVYEAGRRKEGIKLRLASLAIILLIILLSAVLTAITISGSVILDRIMPYYVSDLISAVFITLTALFVAVLLNFFACPYKVKIKEVVSGSLLTTALWLIFLIGFSVYLKFSSPERLYGKIASVIIFLIWCYLMMNSFVIGMIYNGMFKARKVYKNFM